MVSESLQAVLYWDSGLDFLGWVTVLPHATRLVLGESIVQCKSGVAGEAAVARPSALAAPPLVGYLRKRDFVITESRSASTSQSSTSFGVRVSFNLVVHKDLSLKWFSGNRHDDRC